MPEAPASPRPPAIPDYDLIRLVGHGSYGDVWLARSVTGVFRAIKIVWRHRFADSHPYEREFKGLTEFARISLDEPAQLALLHVGRNDPAGFFYYVMELADDIEAGRDIDPDHYTPLTLRELRLRRGRLPAAELIRLAVDLARALAGLHSRGLVHRDIKPANIILVGGTPKLADIGLVTIATSAMTFVGTEGFVPPEGPGTPAADIYSFGKMLYELATGLDRNDYPRLPPELHEWPDRRELMELNEIIIRACDADTRQRYSDAAAMLEELLLAQAGRSVRRLRLTERGLARARRIGAGILLVAAVASLGAYVEHQRANRESAGRRAAEAERDLLARKTVYSATLARAQRALELNAHGQARRLLKELVPAAGVPDLRGFEWHALWHEAQGDPAEVLREEGPTIERTAYSPDGRLLAVHDNSKTVTLYSQTRTTDDGPRTTDLQSGVPVGASLDDARAPTRSPARERRDPAAPAAGYIGPRAAPLAGSENRSQPMTDLQAPPSSSLWSVVRSPVVAGVHRFAGFSPDGQWLLGTTSTYALQRWSTADGEPEGPPQSEGINRPLGVTPDGQLVVFTDGAPDGPPHVVRLWDFDKKTETARFPVAADRSERWDYFRSAVSADGRRLALALVTGRADKSRWELQLRELPSGKLIYYEPLPHRISALGLSPDGQALALALSDTGEIRLWEESSRRWRWQAPAGTGEIRTLAFSRDATQLAAGGSDPAILLLETDNGSPVATRVGQASGTQWLDWAPADQRLVSSGSGGDVRQWSSAAMQVRRELSGLWRPASGGRTIALSSDGTKVALSPDGEKTQVFDTDTLQPLADLPGLLKPFAFSADGTELIGIGTNDLLQRWRWTEASLVSQSAISKPGATVRAAAWRPASGQWAIIDTNGLIHVGLWPVSHVKTIRGDRATGITMVVLTEDGRFVLTNSDNAQRGEIWETSTGTLQGEWRSSQTIRDLAISPDDHLIAVGLENGTIELRSLATQDVLRVIATGDAVANSVVFSPDGSRLICGGADSTLHIYDTSDWRELTTLTARTSESNVGDTRIVHLHMDADGSTLAAYSNDGRLRVWRTR
ncbi:MAG TPA: serine/threonine-protein kinase [Opitutaceae bacterium]